MRNMVTYHERPREDPTNADLALVQLLPHGADDAADLEFTHAAEVVHEEDYLVRPVVLKR
jgi:hypothetical protein